MSKFDNLLFLVSRFAYPIVSIVYFTVVLATTKVDKIYFSQVVFVLIFMQSLASGASLRYFRLQRKGGGRRLLTESFVKYLLWVGLFFGCILSVLFWLTSYLSYDVFWGFSYFFVISLSIPLVFVLRFEYASFDREKAFRFITMLVSLHLASFVLRDLINEDIFIYLLPQALVVLFLVFPKLKTLRVRRILPSVFVFRIGNQTKRSTFVEYSAAIFGTIDALLMTFFNDAIDVERNTYLYRYANYIVAIFTSLSVLFHYRLAAERDGGRLSFFLILTYLGISLLAGIAFLIVSEYLLPNLNLYNNAAFVLIGSFCFFVFISVLSSYINSSFIAGRLPGSSVGAMSLIFILGSVVIFIQQMLGMPLYIAILTKSLIIGLVVLVQISSKVNRWV